MTQEQINKGRIAIAERCGWAIEPDHTGVKPPGCDAFTYRGYHSLWTLIPDYHGSLDAMHEAEKLLTDAQWPEYREHIRTIALGGIRLVSQWCKADMHATAPQRFEAMLRVLGAHPEDAS